MPVTEFQRTVLGLLKQHRNPNSYVAGAIAINREASSSRYSNDIDFFHDTDEAVQQSANSDIAVLRDQRFSIEMLINQPSFLRAVISKGGQALKLEWVRDTAFRFFPVLEDDLLGYRLHDVDLAVNKCLALANRTEVRDIIDLIQMHRSVLSFTGTCWAACGKDPGFTPELLLNCIRRHSIIRPEQLAAEFLQNAIMPSELKQQWLDILATCTSQLEGLPAGDIGCLFLEQDGSVVRDPDAKNINGKLRHFGSIGGSWPRIVAEN